MPETAGENGQATPRPDERQLRLSEATLQTLRDSLGLVPLELVSGLADHLPSPNEILAAIERTTQLLRYYEALHNLVLATVSQDSQLWVDFRGRLSVRARKTIDRLGVVCFRQLTALTAGDILSARNAGMTTLGELREKLARQNMHLAGEGNDHV